MDILVVGAGAVGARVATAASQLGNGPVSVVDRNPEQVERLVATSGSSVMAGQTDSAAEIVVLATPSGTQAALAKKYLTGGRTVLTTSDSVSDTRRLLELDGMAQRQGSLVVIGAGMAPGLNNVLAQKAAADFDTITEVHVAKFGTGGPACARQHHRALAGMAVEWKGDWKYRPGGSGRELCWFPSPVDAADCYRSSLADPLLLFRQFPEAHRITARMAATRRDRITSWLPMLRSPHPEGKQGAVRVEVRGRQGPAWIGQILGAAAAPAVATTAVVVSTIELITTQAINGIGAKGLAEIVDANQFLDVLATHGVVCEKFAGVLEN